MSLLLLCTYGAYCIDRVYTIYNLDKRRISHAHASCMCDVRCGIPIRSTSQYAVTSINYHHSTADGDAFAIWRRAVHHWLLYQHRCALSCGSSRYISYANGYVACYRVYSNPFVPQSIACAAWALSKPALILLCSPRTHVHPPLNLSRPSCLDLRPRINLASTSHQPRINLAPQS